MTATWSTCGSRSQYVIRPHEHQDHRSCGHRMWVRAQATKLSLLISKTTRSLAIDGPNARWQKRFRRWRFRQAVDALSTRVVT